MSSHISRLYQGAVQCHCAHPGSTKELYNVIAHIQAIPQGAVQCYRTYQGCTKELYNVIAHSQAVPGAVQCHRTYSGCTKELYNVIAHVQAVRAILKKRIITIIQGVLFLPKELYSVQYCCTYSGCTRPLKELYCITISHIFGVYSAILKKVLKHAVSSNPGCAR
jgi:hypothetical protein